MSELRIELSSCEPNTHHQVEQLISLLFAVAMKRVIISGQRFDIYKRIRCRGNVFHLASVTETSVHLVVAQQLTSGCGSTIRL